MHAIFRDDLHGRLVVELPGKVFVMGTTPQEITDRLKLMGVTVTSVASQSLLALASSPEIHRDGFGQPLVADRGDRLTFEREYVSDEVIVECLLEAKSRFGTPLVLTGDCQIFKRRMARLAAERGIAISNPELLDVVLSTIRDQRAMKVVAFSGRPESLHRDGAA